MTKFKTLLIGTVIGLFFGLWGGVNIGKGKPLYSNPFSSASVSEQLKGASKTALRQSGEALEKAGESIKNSAQDESKH
ncbi:MAG: hypothetical protein KBT87_08900 [Gammaproteobacteria bacterium]|nr:hypothetical protein [Gammaproteobacteria bacterium]MBQ0774776.1 hypothetical protein [Gammaproteobacteria bacterium]